MRFVRYQTSGSAAPAAGLLQQERVYPFPADAGLLGANGPARFVQMSASERESLARRTLQGSGLSLQEVTLRCPHPHPGKLLALANNFYMHNAPRLPAHATPWIFDKRTDDVAGPGDPIVLWPFARGVVPEIELAVVIGREGRDIPVERALEHAGAYTVCNDVSARELDLPKERRDPAFDEYMDWLNGKWLDGYAILGPALVTPDEVGDVQKLDIAMRLNGETYLTGNTRDQIHTVAQTIAFASRLFALRAGDVITTGMPHGEEPERFFKAGDRFEGEVAGLGVLANPVRAATG